MIPEQRSKVRTLRFEDHRLHLLDQRLLPDAIEYVVCDTAAEVADAIRKMVVRGAPAIGCAAAYGVALEAQRFSGEAKPELARRLSEARRLLAASRPTAVNLFWAVERMARLERDCEPLASAALAARLLAEADRITLEDVENNRSMGRHGAGLLKDGMVVLTHCNAGALATAGHGTALGVIRSAIEAGKRISVLADETRPLLQGARLTAWELSQDRIPTTLITDNMAGHFLARGEIQAVIVGADRVAANGDVANKIGTYMVAVLAARHQIPFYVACPLSTIDLELADGRAIPIEERPESEVTGFRNLRWAPAGIRVRNPAFDITPAELVTALITERGIVERPNTEKLRQHCAR